MSTTGRQDQEFLKEMEGEIVVEISKGILQTAIDWIGYNLNPEDVFENSALETWAENNGYEKPE